MAMDRVGPQGLAVLTRARAAVFGVGVIGGYIARLLAEIFACIVLVDRGYVESANIGGQGFQEADRACPRSWPAGACPAGFNRDCQVETIHADIRDLGFGALGKLDLLFVALDSRSSRVTANQIALGSAYPWIDSAVDGSGRSLVGRVAAYGPGGACYLCPRDAAELAVIMREGHQGCPGWSWGRGGDDAPPTLSLPSLGAAVAGVAVTWGLRMLLGADVAGRELLMDLDHNSFSMRGLPRNPRCLADHRAFQCAAAVRGTIQQTFKEAAGALGGPVELALQRRGIACVIRCPDCGREQRPYKILSAISPAEGACICGGVMQPVAGHVLDRFTLEQATPFLSRTWDDLGLPAADVVVARGPNGEVDLCLI